MIEYALSFKHLSTNSTSCPFVLGTCLRKKINVLTSRVNLNLILVFLQAEVFAELGEVLNGTRPALRNKTTVFKSLGKYFPFRTGTIRLKEEVAQFFISRQKFLLIRKYKLLSLSNVCFLAR